jgi:hypothetical protein
MAKNHHIARIEQESNRNFCWKVAIQRNNKKVVEYFPDGRYGGKRKSLQAAIERRDKLLATAAKPLPSKNRMTTRNSTGKVGVRLSQVKDDRKTNSYLYSYYVAFWSAPNGKPVTIQFSTHKYGKRKAFALASIARDNETRDREWVEHKLANPKLRRSRGNAGPRSS